MQATSDKITKGEKESELLPSQPMVHQASDKPLTVHPVNDANSFLAFIARAASDPAVDVNKMERLYEMAEKMEARQAEIAFNESMAAMSLELPRVKKNGAVEYAVDKSNKSGPKEQAFKFATYEDIDRAIRPILSKHGFTISYTTEPRTSDGGGCVVVGTLRHVRGHKQSASISLALDNSGGKNNLQAMASTTSYGQRYTLKMLINLVFEGEDTDGNLPQPITTEQAAAFDLRLRAISDKALPNFLKWAKVELLTDIQAKNYDKMAKAITNMETEAAAAKAKGAK